MVPRLDDSYTSAAARVTRARVPPRFFDHSISPYLPFGVRAKILFALTYVGQIADESSSMNPLVEAIANFLDNRIHRQRHTALTKQRKRATFS